MRPDKYILENGEPVPVPEGMEGLIRWGKWFEAGENRKVERTHVGDAEVSTVFIGLDHNFVGDGPPLLFETMIFGGAHRDACRRYATLGEAKAGHFEWVEALRSGAPIESL